MIKNKKKNINGMELICKNEKFEIISKNLFGNLKN